MPDVLGSWVGELCSALGIEPSEVDRDLVLDLARDAAHGVARPAAPLTTFLVGYAAGRRGGGPEAIAEATAVVQRLAAARAAEPSSEGSE
jgi:hypothetical protein